MGKPMTASHMQSRTRLVGDCWVWQGAVSKTTGYGVAGGGAEGAHRLMWKLTFGEPPDGQMVLHKCDVRRCINPAHLFLGTHQDNMDDMVNKRRSYQGPQHHFAKMAESDASLIKYLVECGVSQAKLAKLYGVTRQAVWRLMAGLSWRHAKALEFA